nr:MAG TPA: hypothetical protein [Caudoviricetes sp.]DAV93821.1 MAG TPA: hypothetical protein [Caudoviricetes sp.]
MSNELIGFTKRNDTICYKKHDSRGTIPGSFYIF